MTRIPSAIAVLALIVASAPARADDPAPTPEQLDAAKQAFDAAKVLYDAGKLAEAIVQLKESLRLSHNAFLYYNIGHAYDQLGQKPKALAFYDKFLATAPRDAAMRADVQKRVDQLRAEHVQPDLAETYSATDVHHQVIDSVPPGNPVDVAVTVPKDSGFVVTLFYRAGGEESFTPVAMTWRGNELAGRIPAEKLVGSSLHYYVEVKDKAGAVVTRIGKSSSPNLVNIEATATAHFDPTPPPEEDPLVAIARREHAAPPRDKYATAKWASTAAAGVLVAGTAVMYFLAKDYSDKLHFDSTSCGAPPCRAFDQMYDQGIETKGVRYNTLYKVGLGVSIAAIGVAGYFWYRSSRSHRDTRVGARSSPSSQWAIGPMLDAGVVGAAAAARF